MAVRRTVLGAAVAVLLVSGVLPVAVLVAHTLAPGSGALAGVMGSARQWHLARNSVTLATAAALGALALGLPAGILIARTDLPGRRALAAFLALPLLLPPYLTATGWLAAAAPGGPVARAFGPGAARRFATLVTGLPGSALVLATAFAPLVMLLTAAALAALPGRLEEAAELAAPRRTVLLRISLPLVAPGVLLGVSLAFLLALGEATVAPAMRYPVYAVEILTRFAAFYDVRAATAAALPLAAATALVLALEALAVRRTGAARIPGGRGGTPPPRFALGRARIPVAAAAWTVAALVAGTPLAALVLRAGGPAAYAEALARAGDSLGRALALAAAGGTLLAAEGFLLAVLAVESPGVPGRAVDAVALFLFALPGAVTGVGLVLLWNRPVTAFLRATPAVLVLGLLGRYAAVGLRLSRSSLELVPAGLVEAARVAGIGWGRRLLWLLAPSAGRGIAAAWLAGAVFCLRDVAVTMLVHPPGWDTLPVRIMTLAANGAPELIAALCVLLTAVTALPVAAIAGLVGAREAR